MQLSEADWIAIERAYCSGSLANFVRQAWPILDPGMPLVWGPHMDAVCLHLEAITRGQINRLLINIPPGTSKSSLVSIYWPAWEWTFRPEMRFIGASHEQSLAVRDSTKMRRLIMSDWYQKLWPIALMGDNNQKLSFENDRTGFRQAAAVGSMTGRRGDRVVWDDPHSAEDAHSKAALDEAERIFRETLPTRLVSPERSAIVIVMQRLAVKDVSGIILEDENLFGYTHLCLPMEYEPKRHCKTIIGWEDWRKEDGELLFPDRFPRHVVDRDKGLMGSYAVAGQFQQRPSPLGGGIIKSEWFKTYSVLPQIKYQIIYADTAQKTGERNDYSVFECWGLGDDGRAYLIDMIRGKWEAPELERQAIAFWSKHSARKMKVEDKSSGTGLIQSIKKKGRFPIEGIERVKDKLTRVMDILPHIESGYVYLPESAPFVSDFLRECESFTADDSHAHDDQIDPMVDALNDLLGGPGPIRINRAAIANAMRRS
jgi:predicted phage terminase large subunit-like protein